MLKKLILTLLLSLNLSFALKATELTDGCSHLLGLGRVSFEGPNCYNAALIAAGILTPEQVRYVSLSELTRYLQRDYKEVITLEYKPGDLLVFKEKITSNDFHHVAYCLGDSLVFHKGGYTCKYPYEIVKLGKVYQRSSAIEGKKYEIDSIKVYRQKLSKLSIEDPCTNNIRKCIERNILFWGNMVVPNEHTGKFIGVLVSYIQSKCIHAIEKVVCGSILDQLTLLEGEGCNLTDSNPFACRAEKNIPFIVKNMRTRKIIDMFAQLEGVDLAENDLDRILDKSKSFDDVRRFIQSKEQLVTTYSETH